jgi:electron transport complex protein RnfA
MDVGAYFSIAIGVMFINNFVVAKFLGLCPVIGVAKRLDVAFGYGMAATFVMTMSSVVVQLLYVYVLQPNAALLSALFPGTALAKAGLVDVLRTTSYILVIAVLVQLVEMFLRKSVPALYHALGIYLPIITTNCAVLGVVLLNTTNATRQLTFGQAVAQGFFGGVGLTLAMLLMAGIRERLALAHVPKALQDVPITFFAAAFMGLAFQAFAGM